MPRPELTVKSPSVNPDDPNSTTENTYNPLGIAYNSATGTMFVSLAQPISPTAASATVGGRVVDTFGRGLTQARVTMTDQAGNVRITLTNPFGYYRFSDVQTGFTYVFSLNQKRLNFSQPSQVRVVSNDFDDLNFMVKLK